MSDRYFETREQCPACESANTTVIYECEFLQDPVKRFIDLKFTSEAQQIFEGESYVLKKCRDCDLMYQKRILNDEGMNLLYNRWLDEGDKELSDELGPAVKKFTYYSQELLTIATLFDKPISEIRLLDYGMGQGKWCAVARDIGFDVTGTDVSESLMENGRALGLNVVSVSEFGKETYDFINTEQVFEHLGKPLDVLKSLYAALAPGGIIKISVPCGNGIEKRVPSMDWTAPRGHGNYLIPITPAIHVNTFVYKSISEMGARLGLRPVRPRSIFHEYRLLDARSPGALARSIFRPIYRRMIKHTSVYLRAS